MVCQDCILSMTWQACAFIYMRIRFAYYASHYLIFQQLTGNSTSPSQTPPSMSVMLKHSKSQCSSSSPPKGVHMNVFDEVLKRLEIIECTKSGLEQYLTA